MTDYIKCKDCKYFEKWRHSDDVIRKYGQIYSCELLVITDPSPGDYCSKAKEKEKPKTSHWIRVDKNMYSCSNCGHCFSIKPEDNTIKEYKICPNCGVRMESEEKE